MTVYSWAVLVSWCMVCPLLAADWPQWRGPQGNGTVADSPALAEQWPKEGPKKLWTSEAIPTGDAGYGSVTVAGGKAYVYSNPNRQAPWRILSKGALAGQGYAAEMPEDLVKAVEEARASEARKALKEDKAIEAWMAEWTKANLKEGQAKWTNPVRARLRGGAGAIPLDVLARAAALADKRYESQADAQAALAEAGFDAGQQKRLLSMMVPEEKVSEDWVWCLDAESGKTLWKTPLGSQWFYFGSSSTPLVVDGKCYVWNSEGRIYALDAATGKELFKSEPYGPATFHHNRSSSVLRVDNAVIAVTDACLAAADAQTGKTLWQNKKIANQQSSAVVWKGGSKTWLIVYAANGKLQCVDPADGQTKWSANAPGGGAATPTVSGDNVVIATGKDLIAYKLSEEKAEELFKVEWKDSHSSPLLDGQQIYVIGEAYGAPNKARVQCVALSDGKVMWSEPAGNAQLASPLLADGKIIAVAGTELLMFAASPEKFAPLGRVELGLEKWSSPTLVDGKLYLRTTQNVICLDLRK